METLSCQRRPEAQTDPFQSRTPYQGFCNFLPMWPTRRCIRHNLSYRQLAIYVALTGVVNLTYLLTASIYDALSNDREEGAMLLRRGQM